MELESIIKKIHGSMSKLNAFKVFEFEITSFTYWSLNALENFDLCECFNLQELFAWTLAN
jgi:hypothetical protein